MILINKQKVEDLVYSKFDSTLSIKDVLSDIHEDLQSFKYYSDRELKIGIDNVIDNSMKVQDYIILRYKLKCFIEYIDELPGDTRKNVEMKKVFNNILGQELKELV